jgi:hypothetical protein
LRLAAADLTIFSVEAFHRYLACPNSNSVQEETRKKGERSPEVEINLKFVFLLAWRAQE